MKRVLKLASLLLLLTLLGCYESSFPLGRPDASSIDPGLPGAWKCLQRDGEKKPFVMNVMPFDERQYYVELLMEGEKPARYRAFSATIRGTALLNVREIEPSSAQEPRKWVFVRYTLFRPEVLQLDVVIDKPFKAVEPSATAVRAVVEQYIQDPAFYQDFCTCVRSEGRQ